MKMSDLPTEVTEEVLCRIPVTSLRPVRSTCKEWNTLSRCGVFAKKHLAHQAKVAEEAKEDPLVVMMMDYRTVQIKLMCVKSFIATVYCYAFPKTTPGSWFGTLIGGQTRWIECTHSYQVVYKYTYALGYDSNSNSHKILRFIRFLTSFVEYKIYDFSSDSWRILDLLPRDWMIGGWGGRGLSLKGNTYWFAYDNNDSFLVCFDFTRETFWSPLPLPFENAYPQDIVSLSSVREDQLVVLFQPWDVLILEIWISTKIDEPNALSWNNKVFLSVDIRQLIHPMWQFPASAGFFIDEEKKIAVVFVKDTDIDNPTREVAYIIGVDGSFKAADVRECADKILTALVCSYVPSLVQLN
ncbi:F-box protein [Raphanus sativus]|nr:F-box protein [Raphanus sativus]